MRSGVVLSLTSVLRTSILCGYAQFARISSRHAQMADSFLSGWA
ncbi:hypothetical protein RE6C_02332 [Rhodopirellula europaea 6C]|uniref:Uncharacterized protein n=1 Tax=Rhodopirellula europaea 6C TaxID=1263867 RepID=M2B3Z3_9BACT|nr:hypothetical protein RE6C_02332 [Rhodopirellula europaea 6C]